MSSIEGAAPPPDGVSPNFEHPEDVLRTINFVTGVLVIALMVPFIFLQVLLKVLIVRSFVIEDCRLLSTLYLNPQLTS